MTSPGRRAKLMVFPIYGAPVVVGVSAGLLASSILVGLVAGVATSAVLGFSLLAWVMRRTRRYNLPKQSWKEGFGRSSLGADPP